MFPGSSHCTWIETNRNIFVCMGYSEPTTIPNNSHISSLFPLTLANCSLQNIQQDEADYSVTSLELLTVSFPSLRKRKKNNQFFGFKCTKSVLQFQIMGACFQAPCAAPGQRLRETYLGKHEIFNNFFISPSFSSGHCPLFITNHPMHLYWRARWSWNQTVWGFLQYVT